MVSPSASQQGEGVMADTIERTETHRLIASNKVEGTAVSNLENEKLGTIVNVMIDKRSGQNAYAVLELGGHFGIGRDHYHIPWRSETSGGGKAGVRTCKIREGP